MKKKKKTSIRPRIKKKKQEISFDYLRWLSMGFGIASIGIIIVAIMYILTYNK